MDMSNKTLILVFLIIYLSCVSAGQNVPKPGEVHVNILDGEVTVLWKQPADAPSNSQYNVQKGKYTGDWDTVDHCTGIKQTYCDLSSLNNDYRTTYKVRVQLVAGEDKSMWTKFIKFTLNTSKLQPPSFTLWATSSTLTVYVHPKPFLKAMFPYGFTYTIYLEETGQNKKNTTAYLRDDVGDDQRTMSFSSLRWGREYCVSIKVEGNGAPSTNSVSPKQCLQLPERELNKEIIAVSSLSILGVLAIVVITILFYLKQPEKTPFALKSPVSGWLPLSVGEGAVEVVTEKGWFLSSYRTPLKECVKDQVTHVTVKEDNDAEDRRTSLDSGVGMESNSATNTGESPPMTHEDSGCGSLGGPESSTSCQTDYPQQDERTGTDITWKRKDSGVGLACQLDSSSIILDGQDRGSLKVDGSSYQSQRRSVVQIPVCDDEEEFKQMLLDSVLAEVVTGYRAGPQSCICSGAGQCTWCHKQGHYGTEVIKQYRAVCIENGLLSSKCDFVDSHKAEHTFSSYSKTTQMDTVMVDDLETTFLQLGDTFPLLTALSPLPLVEEGHDLNMNNMSPSLCDVQLKTE